MSGPPFARQSAGTPAWALPFGKNLCDNIAGLLDGAGRGVRDAIETLASIGLDEHCRYADIDIGGTMLRLNRDIVGPAPLSIRFGLSARFTAADRLEVVYRQGMVTMRRQMPEAVVIAMKGRTLREVMEVPPGFPGADLRIISSTQEVTHHPAGTITPTQKAFTHAVITLRVPHRRAFLSYDDIEHGRRALALAA